MTAIKSPKVRKSQWTKEDGKVPEVWIGKWIRSGHGYHRAVWHLFSLCLVFCCLHPGSCNGKERTAHGYMELISLDRERDHIKLKTIASLPHPGWGAPIAPPCCLPSHPHLSLQGKYPWALLYLLGLHFPSPSWLVSCGFAPGCQRPLQCMTSPQ